MPAVLIADAQFPSAWRTAFETAFESEGLAIWPDITDAALYDCAIIARPVAGVLSQLPNLTLISSTGMGVDHILGLVDLPRHVPLARVVTHDMVDQVAEYVTLAVLRVERDSDRFDNLQRHVRWERRMTPGPSGKLRIGFLGWGVVAKEAARRLLFLGFDVQAWARSTRKDGDIAVHSEAAGLTSVLRRSDVLVCALPSTRATGNTLNAEALALLPDGAHVVNVGRGEHIDDEALLGALDSGRLSGATLDVFRIEPLPAAHAFWRHLRIRITPHSAGLLSPSDCAAAILGNLRRVRAGLPPEHQVCLDAGF